MKHLKKGSKGWTHCERRPGLMMLTERIEETTCIECLERCESALKGDMEKKKKKLFYVVARKHALEKNGSEK